MRNHTRKMLVFPDLGGRAGWLLSRPKDSLCPWNVILYPQTSPRSTYFLSLAPPHSQVDTTILCGDSRHPVILSEACRGAKRIGMRSRKIPTASTSPAFAQYPKSRGRP